MVQKFDVNFKGKNVTFKLKRLFILNYSVKNDTPDLTKHI